MCVKSRAGHAGGPGEIGEIALHISGGMRYIGLAFLILKTNNLRSLAMKRNVMQATLLVAGFLAASVAQAQQKVDFGKMEFDRSCASCHGADGKGNGPMGNFLKTSPPDLTKLAKANQGVFPMSRLYEVVEGAGVPAHGSRDMPVWGREYAIQESRNGLYDTPAIARARILTLLEYISRIQAK